MRQEPQVPIGAVVEVMDAYEVLVFLPEITRHRSNSEASAHNFKYTHHRIEHCGLSPFVFASKGKFAHWGLVQIIAEQNPMVGRGVLILDGPPVVAMGIGCKRQFCQVASNPVFGGRICWSDRDVRIPLHEVERVHI